jgi:protocatechuate 3,4-dioxygenase alpha subunit
MTPSQTIGPFFGFALPWPAGAHVVPEGTPGTIRLFGHLLDGRGEPVTDALIESWQCDGEGRFAGGGAASWFRGFGRCATDRAGAFTLITVKPGASHNAKLVHAPHVLLRRGCATSMDRRCTTRRRCRSAGSRRADMADSEAAR